VINLPGALQPSQSTLVHEDRTPFRFVINVTDLHADRPHHSTLAEPNLRRGCALVLVRRLWVDQAVLQRCSSISFNPDLNGTRVLPAPKSDKGA